MENRKWYNIFTIALMHILSEFSMCLKTYERECMCIV